MKKLKTIYCSYLRLADSGNEMRVYYPYIRSGPHKRFSTKQEKSYYFLHAIEYKGTLLRLRAARGKALADHWDDYSSGAYDLRYSWKHNSKRRNQYYK